MPPKPSVGELAPRPRPGRRGRPREPRLRAWSASHVGVLRLDGTVASVRDRQPARRRRTAARASERGRRRRSARRARRARPAGARAGSERQWKTNEPSIVPDHERLQPDARVHGRDRGGHGVAVPGRPGQRRAGRRKSWGEPRADADQQHAAQVGVVGDAGRDRQGGDLAGLARSRRAASRTASRSVPEAVPDLGRHRARAAAGRPPPAPGSATDVDAARRLSGPVGARR